MKPSFGPGLLHKAIFVPDLCGLWRVSVMKLIWTMISTVRDDALCYHDDHDTYLKKIDAVFSRLTYNIYVCEFFIGVF